MNAEASQRLADIAAVIVNHGGTSQANDAGNNWKANRGASAGIALLATDSPFDESLAVSAHNRVVNHLNRNAGNGESRGWNPEGFGHTAYALGQAHSGGDGLGFRVIVGGGPFVIGGGAQQSREPAQSTHRDAGRFG